MLAALDNDAGLQADVPSLELFLVVSRITGVVINVICVGSGHVGELGPKTDNHLRPFCNEMVTCLAEYIGHGHSIRVSANPTYVIDLSELSSDTRARHH